MTTRDLGDVVVRARGLARHLLDPRELGRLVHAGSSAALGASLADLGYWPAPSSGAPALPAAMVITRSIEHATLGRLSVLVRWLDDRIERFAPLFDLELRDALRIRLGELADPASRGAPSALGFRSGWPALRELRLRIARASDPKALVHGLRRAGSAFAEPLHAALRASSGDRRALLSAVDHAWAERAQRTVARRRGALRSWVEEEIDLGNAWNALFGAGGDFLPGGRRLDASAVAAIAAEGDPAARRRLLAAAFDPGPLEAVFADPSLGVDVLEAAARRARIAALHREARLDPTGEAALLEVVLRVHAERADLRCIAFGVAAGLSVPAIASRLGRIA